MTPLNKALLNKESIAQKRSWLVNYIDETKLQLATARKKERLFGWIRLVLFIAGIGGFVLLHFNWIFAVCFTAGFMVIVSKHNAQQRLRQKDDALILVSEKTLSLLGGAVITENNMAQPGNMSAPLENLKSLLDQGEPYPLTEQESDDLDLFAPTGLFGLMNQCSTTLGAVRLAKQLMSPNLDKTQIERRQTTIAWLDEHPIERLSLMQCALGLKGSDAICGKLKKAVCESKPFTHSKRILFARIWTFVALAIFTFIIYKVVTGDGALAGTLLLPTLIMNIVLFTMVKSEVAPVVKAYGDTSPFLRGWQPFVRQASNSLPTHSEVDTELGQLKTCFDTLYQKQVITKLEKILSWSEIGFGPLKSGLNALCLYDVHIAAKINRVILSNKKMIMDAISATGDIEALYSLANFCWTQPVTCYPNIETETTLDIQTGFHPLIEPNISVANSISLNKTCHVLLITGPNAAGKSTLLRMATINTLLAQIGCAACSKNMSLAPMRIMTDLKVNDNLAKHESYFVSEVRHLKRMITPAQHSAPLFGLMDEPLRGTNSPERIAASVALVEWLLESNHIFFVATHEDALTDIIDNDGRGKNVHFHEALDTDTVVYDYKLKDGPATSRTAIRIIEQEGYPKSLVARAKQYINDILDGAKIG
jgi:hypothetical protein